MTISSQTLFTSRIITWLRLPVLALMMFVFVAGPLLTLPTYAQAQGSIPRTDQTGKQPNEPTNPLDCSWSNISVCVASLFYTLFVQLTGLIAYFGGVVFDFMASIALQGGTYADEIINKGWTVARDLANMAFVFLLVYLAFQLIFNVEGVGAGKTLAKLIVVALLINFSFFFTRVIIDTSNILAHQFYDHTNGRTSQTSTAGDIKIAAKPLEVKYISENIMNGLNVQGIISTQSFQAFYQSNGFLGNVAILIGLFFMFGVINLILAFVFFTAAVQFLSRIVSLWMAIILSPIGFISFIIPGLSKVSRDWWDGLIKNAFFAPAFLFFFYIIVMFLDKGLLGSSIGSSLYAAAQNSGAGAGTVENFFRPIITIMIRLGVVVGLLMAALKVGDIFGQASAKAVVGGAMKFAGGAASGFGLGAAGFVGRNTIGRLAMRASNNQGLLKGASSGRLSSLYTWRALNRVASSSFDARAAAPTTAARLGLGSASGVGGRVEAVRRNEKEHNTIMAKITPPETPRTAANDNAVNANVKAETANIAVAQDMKLVDAMQGLTEQMKQTESALLGQQFKNLEKEAGDKQTAEKISDLTKRLAVANENEPSHAEGGHNSVSEDALANALRHSNNLSGAELIDKAVGSYAEKKDDAPNRGESKPDRGDDEPPPRPTTPAAQRPVANDNMPTPTVVEVPALQKGGDARIAQINRESANDNRTSKSANDAAASPKKDTA